MNRIVVDASVALQWFLEDELGREYSLKSLHYLNRGRLLVPTLWFYEVGNGLLLAHRRQRIRLDHVSTFMARLLGMPIDIHPAVPAKIAELPMLAHQHGLTSYDASYLAVAIEMKCELATQDRKLQSAAAATGVTVFTG